MDSKNGLNLLYARTYDVVGLSQAMVWLFDAPFYGVVLGIQVVPLGQVDLPMMFRAQANFYTKMLTFEIGNFPSAYHVILGRPCYAKFMVIPNYTNLKLKMPDPHGSSL